MSILDSEFIKGLELEVILALQRLYIQTLLSLGLRLLALGANL